MEALNPRENIFRKKDLGVFYDSIVSARQARGQKEHPYNRQQRSRVTMSEKKKKRQKRS